MATHTKRDNSNLRVMQRHALSLYFFSIHFESRDPLNTGIDFLNTKITIVFYIAVMSVGLKGLKSLKPFKLFLLPIIFLFIIQTVSGYIYQRPGHTDYFSIVFFLNMIVFLLMLIHQQRDSRALVQALNFYVSGGLIMVCFFLLGIETDYSFQGRASIFGSNANAVGINLSIVGLLMALRLFVDKKISFNLKLIYLSFAPLILFFIASTGSRSSFISFFSGLLVLIIFKKEKPIRKVTSLIIGFFISFLISLYFLNNKIIGSRLGRAIDEGDLSGRDELWVTISELANINALWGIGHTGYSFETIYLYGQYTSAHNVFVETLITGGVFSLVLIIIFFWKIIIRAFSNYKVIDNVSSLVFLMPITVTVVVAHPFGTKIVWALFVMIITSQYQSNMVRTKRIKNENRQN